MGTKLSNTAFAPVFSSELARHINNPGRLGLDDLSFAWGKYEVTVGTEVTTGRCGRDQGMDREWTSQPQVSADETNRPCLLGKCQPDWQRDAAVLEMPFNPPCPLVGTRFSPGPEL